MLGERAPADCSGTPIAKGPADTALAPIGWGTAGIYPPGVHTSLDGTCDPRFEAVRQAFAENFVSRDEIGAGVCVRIGGATVVDLWGGWRDAARTTPWERDTLVNIFSVGKGVSAVCVARLVGQGHFDYDTPVARLWPEFAAGGKDEVTVRQLLSHQAGLPAVRERLPAGSVFDGEVLVRALAAQKPWWAPGEAHGYHVNTFGVLVGELVRRVTGRSLGAMVRDEIAGPLGADLAVGVAKHDLSRIAEFIGLPDTPPPAIDIEGEAQRMERQAYYNPPEFSGFGVVNTARWQTTELPSTNGHATAEGIARLYGALVAGGTADGVEIVDAVALGEATQEQVYGEDLILHRASRFGIGFQLTQEERRLGPNPLAFGHFGAGGSLGFCDPDAELAFGYAINTMGPRWQNPRNRALVDAVYACL
jgi:CubicO group peptidase (beta-lactamase class C family)